MRKTDELTEKKDKKGGFLSKFKAEIAEIEGSAEPPKYWMSWGNYCINRVMTGSFKRGIPQGRLVSLAGPSGAGKSYLIASLLREAEKHNAYRVVLDSENALDNEFVEKIGVDPSENYVYASISTIEEMQSTVSTFIKGYQAEYGDDENAPKVLIAIDSLDMLQTVTEQENFNKGVQKGDQGQRNKQLKAVLRNFTQAIKYLNITIVCTSQVYKNQDPYSSDGPYVVSEAVRFAPSQIAMLTRLKLKNKDKDVIGIRLVVNAFKTRFCKPFQAVEIEIPYDEGMDPYNGLLDAAVGIGAVDQRGAWYYINGTDTKFQSSSFSDHAERILELCEERTDAYLKVNIDPNDVVVDDKSVKQQRNEIRGLDSELKK